MRKRTALFVTLALLFNNSLPLITFPLLTKTFDITTYGTWIEASTIVSLVIIFATQGLSNAFGLLIANSSEERNQIYSSALAAFIGISIAAVGIVYLLAPAINSATIRSQVGIDIIRLLSIQVVFYGLNYWVFQIYRMRQQLVTATLLDVILNIARLVSVFYAATNKNLLMFASISVLLHGIITLIQVLLVTRLIQLKRPKFLLMRKFIVDGINLSLVSQSSWLVMYGDRLMLSVLASSSVVAVYAASYQLTLIINALGYPYLYQLLPTLGEFWKAQQAAAMKTAVRNATRLIAILLIPAIIGLATTGNALLGVLATKEFIQSNVLIGMIAAGIGLDTLGTALQYIFYTQGRPDVLRNIYLRAAALNIVANLIAIPLFSYNGAGLTTLLTFLYVFYSLLRKTEMSFNDLFDLDTLTRCLFAGLAMGAFVLLLVDASIPRLALVIIGGALIYGVGLLALKVLSLNEMTALYSGLFRRVR